MFFIKKQEFRSALFNEKNFYAQFLKDLAKSKREIIIESPYITASRMEMLYPVFERLISQKVKISIVTREPVEHDDDYMRHQSTNEILRCKELGINLILLKGYHHRKLAIIDKSILWEGSLNILSFSKSREIMRRIESENYVNQMLKFLRLGS
jgi:phosphatidylserine/phosphatidylglycerophosphate/cardiolipin synthase-like enzyme